MARARHAWDSTPLINVIQQNPRACREVSDTLIELAYTRPRHLDGRVGCVEWLKSKLGRQSYCWNGEYRFWVWELYEKRVRVYASNIQGWSFEVRTGLRPHEAMGLWRKFVEAVHG